MALPTRTHPFVVPAHSRGTCPEPGKGIGRWWAVQHLAETGGARGVGPGPREGRGGGGHLAALVGRAAAVGMRGPEETGARSGWNPGRDQSKHSCTHALGPEHRHPKRAGLGYLCALV